MFKRFDFFDSHITCNIFIHLFRYWFVAWNSMKLVLSQFIVNLFLTHHKYNSLNFDTFAIRLFKFSSYMNRAVSYASSLIQSCSTARYISSIYNENSSGPNTGPCGTPHFTSSIKDLTPLVTVYCFRFLGYDFKKSFAWPRIPYLSILSSNISWSTVSNTFVRSTKH